MENIEDVNMRSKIKNLSKKVMTFFVDHFHLLFKSGADNYMRIQQLRKRETSKSMKNLALADQTCVKNEDGTYQCSIKFESYSALKNYQKKLRTLTVSLSSAVAMVIVAFLVAPYVMNPNRSSASSFQWVQTGWGTHITNPDAEPAQSPDDKTVWDKYYSKDAGITANATDITMTPPTPNSVADGDFSGASGSADGLTAGTFDSSIMYKTTANTLSLKKFCSSTPECQAGDTCYNNFCTVACTGAETDGSFCMFNGLAYGVVQGEDGRLWLDRNLGATQVATAYNDPNAYGWLFQWGRKADGHQLPTSLLNGSRATSTTPNHDQFITHTSTPYDWLGTPNNTLWNSVSSANNPCPPGFRLPIGGANGVGEWDKFITDANIKTCSTGCLVKAFDTKLKLTAAGRRVNNGNLGVQGTEGYYWSNTVHTVSTQMVSPRLQANSIAPNATTTSVATAHAYGLSVRCIKN